MYFPFLVMKNVYVVLFIQNTSKLDTYKRKMSMKTKGNGVTLNDVVFHQCFYFVNFTFIYLFFKFLIWTKAPSLNDHSHGGALWLQNLAWSSHSLFSMSIIYVSSPLFFFFCQSHPFIFSFSKFSLQTPPTQ